MPVALITGCSSGIGLSTAVLLAQNGYKVYASMRDTNKSVALLAAAEAKKTNVNVVALDVQDEKSVKDCIDTIIAKDGAIDILINNAGYGFFRVAETATMKEVHDVMDVNFYGVLRTTHAVLPYMRKNKSGRIINVSSVGGIVGQPFNEVYCAAKFAVEGYTEGSAPLLEKFGIFVSLIEPGPVVTEFTGRVRADAEKNFGSVPDDYKPWLQLSFINSKKRFASAAAQTGDDVAQVILKCVQDKEPLLRYPTSEAAAVFNGVKLADLDGSKIKATVSERYFAKE